jgi:hypothetical protein
MVFVMHRSPPLGLLASVFAGLFLARVATSIGNPDALRVSAFLQFGASIPLGLFSVVFVSRLLFLRINVAGVYIALFGGIAASVLLAVSGLAMWIAAEPALANEAGALRAITLLASATAGFGYTAALGLLLAGVSIPSLVFGLMPRWVCWFGLAVAGIAELSVLSMIVPALLPMLALTHFPALGWLVVAGFAIPKRRLMTFDRVTGATELPTMRTRLEGA